MKHKALSLQSDFEVAFAVRKVQAAEMTLAPGSNTGGPDNRHSGADQWMYVVSGSGLAIVDGVRQPLQAGSLLVIEHGETHEIRCTGDEPLCTVNFYSPPAYDKTGDTLPATVDSRLHWLTCALAPTLLKRCANRFRCASRPARWRGA